MFERKHSSQDFHSMIPKTNTYELFGHRKVTYLLSASVFSSVSVLIVSFLHGINLVDPCKTLGLVARI